MQHCAIFRNRKNAKRREPTNTGRGPGLKGTGSGRIKPPSPPPPPTIYRKKTLTGLYAKWDSFTPRKYKINCKIKRDVPVSRGLIEIPP